MTRLELFSTQSTQNTQKAGQILAVLLFCFVLPVLTACAKKPEERLEGERLPVFAVGRTEATSTNLLADHEVDVSEIVLPQIGTANDWAQSSGTAAGNLGRVSLPAPTSLRQVWSASFATPPSPAQALQPVVLGDRVVVYDGKNLVTALSLESGARLWQQELSSEGERGAFFGGGVALSSEEKTAYVSTGFGLVYSLSLEDGTERWRVATREPIRAAPTVDRGRVFVITLSNRTIAFSASDGSVLWTHAGSPQQVYVSYSAPAAVDGGSLLAPHSTGEFIAIVSESGTDLWARQSAAFDALEATILRAPTAPTLEGGQGFMLGPTGLLAVTLFDGAELWESRIESDQRPWLGGSHLYAIHQSSLVAFNRNDGALRWQRSLESQDTQSRTSPRWFSPRLVENGLLVTSSLGDLLILDPDTGVTVSEATISPLPFAAPVIAGRTLLYGTQDGRLVALR